MGLAFSELPFELNRAARIPKQLPINESKGRNDGHIRYLLTVSGCGVLNMDGEQYVLPRGTGFLLDDGPCEYHSQDDTPWEVQYVRFKGYAVHDFLKYTGLQTRRVYYLRDITTITTLLNDLVLYSPDFNPSISSLTASAELYSFLVELQKRLYTTPQKLGLSTPEKLQVVLEFMNRNLRRTPTLAEFAEVLNITPQYLCALFSEYYHTTPIKYFTELKINYSKQLLLSEFNYSIRDIAQDLDFVTPNYFTRVFKKVTGVTPREFKKMNSIL